MLKIDTEKINDEDKYKCALEFIRILNRKDIVRVKVLNNDTRKGYGVIDQPEVQLGELKEILTTKLSNSGSKKLIGDTLIAGHSFKLLMCYQQHIHFICNDQLLTESVETAFRNFGFKYSIENIPVEVLSEDKLLSISELIRENPQETHSKLLEAITNEPNNLTLLESHLLKYNKKPEELLRIENQKFLDILDEIGGITTLRLLITLGKSSLNVKEVTLRIMHSLTYYTEMLSNNKHPQLKQELVDYLINAIDFWSEREDSVSKQIATVISPWSKKISKSHVNDYGDLSLEDIRSTLLEIKT